MVGPAPAPGVPPAPWHGSTWLKGALVAIVVVASDAWVKVMARVAACPTTQDVREALRTVYSVPPDCGSTDFWGFAQLSPLVRDGGLLGIGAGLLDGSAGGIWAIGVLAIAAVVSILVLRWRWRSPGDALALGALWGAAIVESGPRLLSEGTGTAELSIGGASTGLGDLALLWAVLWLGWRVIAESRA